MNLNHFGSRIKHSCLRIYGELVCKGFARSFDNLWRLDSNRNCTTPSKCLFTGQGDCLLCAAENRFHVMILNPFQESYLLRGAEKFPLGSE